MKTKVLGRDVVCPLFPIKVPIWDSNKQRCVGLNVDRVAEHNAIEISYKRKSDGVKLYPDQYYFDGSLVNHYPHKQYEWGVAVIVPIKDLMLLQREGDPPKTQADWLNDPRYAKTKEELERQ